MKGHRLLVTGGSGFIGQALADRLRKLGCDVTTLGRRQLDDENYVSYDLTAPFPHNWLSSFDVVIHAAARSSPWGTRREYELNNVVATQNVVDYCQSSGLPKLIFISSSSVYYRPEHQLGITEETPLPEQNVNQYAATKKQAEERIRNYAGPWTILRPRAVYGPGDTVLLPRILTAARQGRLPVLHSADGPVIGDLIYVDNLVDAVVAAVECQSAEGETINLTNDDPVPILDFLFDIFDRLDIPRPTRRVSTGMAMGVATGLELFHRLLLPRVEPAITRFGVHVFRYSKTFDVSKAKSLLGPPKVDNATSVEKTVEWFRSQRSSGETP